MTDQTSAHDLLDGYVPAGLSLPEAAELRKRDPDDRLAFEIDRLHRSARRLIWLNPLLRFAGFEAKAKGIRAMLSYA